MVQTQGKQNKRVAILLTPDMTASIDMLNSHRKSVGIKKKNKYIFASSGVGPLDCFQVLQKVAKDAGCQNPKLITSTRLRKYLATVSQVILHC